MISSTSNNTVCSSSKWLQKNKWLQKKGGKKFRLWKKIDEKKNGTGLAAKGNPDWFKIINPVFRDTNSSLENVCSNHCDTSFYSKNFSGNDDGERPNSEECNQAVESQIDEECATDKLLTVVLIKVKLKKAFSHRRKTGGRGKCKTIENGRKKSWCTASVQK